MDSYTNSANVIAADVCDVSVETTRTRALEWFMRPVDPSTFGMKHQSPGSARRSPDLT